jgi:dUTP pyrophosphatase
MTGEGPLIRVLKKDPQARLPEYASAGAAGADIRARLTEPLSLLPRGRVRVPTGIALEIPPGYEAQVRPLSGLAAKQGITVLNSPGTIDSDYRGELEIILINLGEDAFTIADGDRIAQLVIAPVCRSRIEEAAALSETGRGTGGFGSTGLRGI